MIITTKGGRTKELPEHMDPARVAGLDEDGRIVVDDFGARSYSGPAKDRPHMFGLTLCCNAYDKGYEDGVYCRRCAGAKPHADVGNYLFPMNDAYPDLDEVESIA